MTETIPQPRVAEEGDLADSPDTGPGLLVYAPLRFEANAVRRGLTRSSSHVQRTGMGATRSRKSAGESQPGPFGAMVVMGTAAGLAADLSPGDLVVATEVTDGETTIALPGADLLAAELRRAGLNARAGRVIQVKKIIGSSERSRLAADGYLAADMESAAIVAAVKGLAPSVQESATTAAGGDAATTADGDAATTADGDAATTAHGDAAQAAPGDAGPTALGSGDAASPGAVNTGALSPVDAAALAAASAGRPVAIIRAVSDGGFGPGMVTGGMAALRSLRAAAPVAERWAAACRARTVLLAGPRSFCAGVERAIEIVERALELRGAPVYVRKQIVHNTRVVADLEQRGAIFVDELDEVPNGATVVFSAHGVAPAVRVRRIRARPCRSSTRPARWCRRCTPRRAGSPRRATRSR